MLKLLIADDEIIIRKGLGSIDWKSIDVVVCGIARDGEEALNIAKEENPDIILSDIRMPGISGLELAAKLISQNPSCIVIFLSGYSDFQYAHTALKMGAFNYLLKPTSPEEILDCVANAVQKIKSMQTQHAFIVQMQNKLKHAQFAKIHTPVQEEHIAPTLHNIIGEILSYIERNYQDNITLASISEKFHFNPIYINRVLKRETGCTVMEIVNIIRLDHSAHLLRSTNCQISEIAKQVGIHDSRYFSQVFKKAYGCTPAQFRKLPDVIIEKAVLTQLLKRFSQYSGSLVNEVKNEKSAKG